MVSWESQWSSIIDDTSSKARDFQSKRLLIFCLEFKFQAINT